MEKRLFIAILLSLLFLSVYYKFMSVRYPAAQQEVIDVESPLPSSSEKITSNEKFDLDKTKVEHQKSINTDQLSLETIDNEQLVTLESDDLVVFFNPKGAYIEKCLVKEYDNFLPQTKLGLIPEYQDKEFDYGFIADGIVFTYKDKISGLTVNRSFQFVDGYGLNCSIEFITSSPTIDYANYTFNCGSILQSELKKRSIEQRYYEFSISLKDKVLRQNFSNFNVKKVGDNDIAWIGIRDRYFCSIIRPDFQLSKIESVKNEMAISYLFSRSVSLKGNKATDSFMFYLGPQKREFISMFDEDMASIINFGFLDSLCHIVLGGLNFLHKITKNWGVTILLFSILVFALISPLSKKSFSSIKRMQELQPLMEELRKKHKDNPQKLNKEVMEMYKEKGINPLGGCLPLFLQMPVFISLYQSLIRLIDLKGANFLWIKDLSEPDRLFTLGTSLPVIGNEINILPMIMMATMLIQQKISSVKTQSESSQQQAMMGWFMAIFFGFIFYHMPSGLVLYWVTNSVLMLVFQGRMYLKHPHTAPKTN